MGNHIPALKHALSVCLNKSQKHNVHYRQTVNVTNNEYHNPCPHCKVSCSNTGKDSCLAQAKEVILQISCQANKG